MNPEDIMKMLQEQALASKAQSTKDRSFADRLRDERTAALSSISASAGKEFAAPGAVPINPMDRMGRENAFMAAAKGFAQPVLDYQQAAQSGEKQYGDILSNIYQLTQADKKIQESTGTTIDDLLKKQKALKDAGYDTSSIDKVIQETYGIGKSDVTKEKQQTKDEVVTLAKEMLNDNSFWGGTKSISGLFQGFAKVPGTKASDIANKYDTLKALLTLDNLDKMKGVLSDSDIEILKQASSELNRNQSEPAFRKSLENIVSKLGGDLGSGELDSIDEAIIKKYGGK